MSIKIGIIGAGRIGRVHADALCRRTPDAQVVAIADVNDQHRTPRAMCYGSPGPFLDGRPGHVLFECFRSLPDAEEDR